MADRGVIADVINMLRLALLINPPVPFVKGGTYEGLKVYQHTYGRNEHSRSVRRSPLFQKGGQGGFYLVGHSLQSELISDNYFITASWTIPEE